MGFHGIYPLVSSNMSSWKIPELKGGVNRTITDKWFIFQQAMFDYRMVPTFAIAQKSSSHGGKYISTMEHMGFKLF